MLWFSRENIRRLDEAAVSRFAIPSIVLMENAAAGLARVVREEAVLAPRRGVVVVAGAGNNGGDGLAAARHLHNAGVDVRICLCAHPDNLRGDASTNGEITRRMRIPAWLAAGPDDVPELLSGQAAWGGSPDPLWRPGLVVDALLGTGLSGRARGRAAGIIAAINRLRDKDGCRVVAADVPSGLDADAGIPPGGEVVRADATATFVGCKRGMRGAEAVLGRVVVVDIGAPAALARELADP